MTRDNRMFTPAEEKAMLEEVRRIAISEATITKRDVLEFINHILAQARNRDDDRVAI